MLTEIRSRVLRHGPLTFGAGLNVVIGDRRATNSIGKSTVLMLVDFAFGGSAFLEHKKDAVVALGHHSYEFCFKLCGEDHYFRRDTAAPDWVHQCDLNYSSQRTIHIDDYLAWLKKCYIPKIHGLTFRALVSTFSRIWPKDNIKIIEKPLHAVANQAAGDAVNTLIKVFEMFEKIETAQADLKKKEDEKKAFKKAVEYSIVDNVGKRQYAKNESELDKISSEVDEIKEDLAKYALNIRALVDKNLLELKQSKDMLLDERLRVDEKLTRIHRNISLNKHIRSEQLDSLVDFFPDVNVERIAKIEEFHSEVAAFLKKELVESEASLKSQRQQIEIALQEIDAQITSQLSDYDNPTVLVDRVYGLSQQWNRIKKENSVYIMRERIENEYTKSKESLTSIKLVLVKDIERIVNQEILTIVSKVYGEDSRAPTLLLGENSYKYEVFEDTGTGKAFAGLVIFDLAIFALTDLPILIHDSPLYKNVENQAVAKFIKEYVAYDKQSFIALDEIDKYGPEAVSTLRSNCVVELSDTKVLYILDWRSKSNDQSI